VPLPKLAEPATPPKLAQPAVDRSWWRVLRRARRTAGPRAANRRAAGTAGTGRRTAITTCGAIPGAPDAQSTHVPPPTLAKLVTSCSPPWKIREMPSA